MLIWRVSSLHGVLIAGALAIVWLLPNTPQYIERLGGAVERLSGSGWPTIRWPLRHLRWPAALAAGNRFLQGSCVGLLLALALLRALSVAPSEFLYYTF